MDTDADREGQQRLSPLMVAVRDGKVAEVVAELLHGGADPNARSFPDGLTPLMFASERTRVEALRALIAAGARLDARSRHGQTPLMAAAARSTPEIVQVLLEAGSDLEAQDLNGLTPLMHAVRQVRLKAAELLLRAGAQLETCDLRGQTALMHAVASAPDQELVRTLLAAGASCKAKSEEGQTAFEIAERNPRLRGTPVFWELCQGRF